MLSISLRPSWRLLLILAAAHVMAAGCAALSLPLGWGCTAAAVGLASLCFHARRDALLKAPGSVTGITLDREGRCALRSGEGGELEGRVLASTFVSVALVVIHLRLDSGRKRSVVLLSDSADAEDLRRLRVRLRHGLHGLDPASGRP
jgi:toxin CptA